MGQSKNNEKSNGWNDRTPAQITTNTNRFLGAMRAESLKLSILVALAFWCERLELR